MASHWSITMLQNPILSGAVILIVPLQNGTDVRERLNALNGDVKCQTAEQS